LPASIARALPAHCPRIARALPAHCSRPCRTAVQQAQSQDLLQKVNVTRSAIASALLLLLPASQGTAQAHDHSSSTPEKLGTVHFSTSCAPAVAPQFDRAVTLLHSFEFGAAIRGFNDVIAADSTCAMAQWGIALSRWSNPMTAGLRSPASLERGRLAAAAATRLGDKATERERGYISAVGRLYADYEHTTQRDRIVAYEQSMAQVAARIPPDTEAMIFHAISLVASAPPTDKTYANQRKAGAVLEALWARQANHPGLAHYIIHAYDVPALASQAQSAAARYADIAPSAAHALHMPSHTFTRVGLWQESVNTNLRSIEAARRDSALGEMLHASDYLVYAYLQMRKDSAAKEILDGLPSIAAKFDANAITGAAPGSAGVFALAAIPARYALERREWKEAASLSPKSSAFAYTEAMTCFARALGAAHTGDMGRARASIDAMTGMRERLVSAGEAYWAEQVGIEILEARAALDLAEGRRDEALAGMRNAVVREDATEKSAVTPGPLVPAHELLGDMLMELKRPAAALVEYRESLTREPNRFRTLYGAMKAASASGDQAARADYARQIARLTGTSAFAR
jgi:hypothetical protein